MKKILIGLIIGVATIGLISCDVSSTQAKTDKTVKIEQEQMLSEALNQVGLPDITNFTEMKLLKRIFELRDKSDLITYAYTQNMNGKYIYLGKCIGYGLPYSVQCTNPQKMEKVNNSYDAGDVPYTLPQADPNGLFMPEGLDATWLILLDESTGEESMVYVESDITVLQTKLPDRLCESWSLPENY